MTDAEFVAEVRRHVIAIIKAVYKRFGVDLFNFNLPSPVGLGLPAHEESPEIRPILTGDPSWKLSEQSEPKENSG
jgi:hypothetical protein